MEEAEGETLDAIWRIQRRSFGLSGPDSGNGGSWDRDQIHAEANDARDLWRNCTHQRRVCILLFLVRFGVSGCIETLASHVLLDLGICWPFYVS